MKKSKENIFTKWFLNNRFSVGLLNILLFLLIIFAFNQVSFIFSPVRIFFNAILPPVIVALLQYYLMNPVVDYLERKFKIPRIATIIVIFVIVLLLLIWVINSLVPVVQNQIESLLKNWPSIWKNAVGTFQSILNDPHLTTVKDSLQSQVDKLQSNVTKSLEGAITTALNNLSNAVSVATTIFTTLVTSPFILFFMLKDGHQMRPYLVKFMPQRWEKATNQLLQELNGALSSYVTGQVLVAFWVGVMFFVGYTIVGQSYAAALGVLAGFMNLIPYFGTFIAFIPSLIIASVTSFSMLIKVIIVFLVEQTIESRVVSPLVVGNKMKMHPITTILILLGTGAVWGLWGVIVGIPAYAILKILVGHLYHYYRRVSHLYDDNFDDNVKEDSKEKSELEGTKH